MSADDREAILARRRRYLTVALTTAGLVATGCEEQTPGPVVCLTAQGVDRPSLPTTADAGDAPAASSSGAPTAVPSAASDGAPTATVSATPGQAPAPPRPRACLRFVQPKPPPVPCLTPVRPKPGDDPF